MITAARTRRRLLVAAALAAVGVLWVGTSDTFSAWTSGSVGNPGNSVGSGTLAVSHSYNGSTCAAGLAASATTTACTGSLLPTTSATSRTETITNTGTTATSATTNTYQVAGCGPIALDNTGTVKATDDLLVRNGTTFSPSTGPFNGAGSVTFNGTTGYASAAVARTEPSAPIANGTTLTYGYGIWFKTADVTTNVALFGLTASAGNTDTTGDRVLYMNASGQLIFVSSGIPFLATTPNLDNGAWHFAYVLLTSSRSSGGAVSSKVSMTIDGNAGFTNLTVTLTATVGFWHVGWAPVSNNTTRYFGGSLSGFSIDTSGTAAFPSGLPTGYTPGTEQWRMDDSGGAYDGTTVSGIWTGTNPFGSSDACAVVTANWSGAVAYSGSLRALVGSVRTATYPAPGASSTATMALTSASTPTVLKNLLVYAPIRADYRSGSNWTLALTWAASGTALVLQ